MVLSCALLRIAGLIALLLPGFGLVSNDPVAGASLPASSISLVGQSPAVVEANGSLTLTLHLSSVLPAKSLGLSLLLYPCVANVSAFASPPQVGATELPSQGPIPVKGGNVAPNGATSVVSVAVNGGAVAHPNANTVVAPLSCPNPVMDGDYPLTVQLVERGTDTPLAALTTHLVYVANPSESLPLRVALVLPVGTGTDLTPLHTATLKTSEITDLGALIGALNSQPDVPVALDVYPQLLLALQGAKKLPAAAARNSALERLVGQREKNGNVELMRTGFTDLSVSALAAAGLGSDLSAQFARAATLLKQTFSLNVTGAPYVTNGPLTAAGFTDLRSTGVNEIVVPTEDLSVTTSHLQTAPFALGSTTASASRESTTAFATDPALGAYIENPKDDPVLAANDLLAELAQIYFDAPEAEDPRGVVIAPPQLPTGARALRSVLNTLLAGLSNDPIVAPDTVSGLFTEVPIGSDGNATTGTLHPAGSWSALPGDAIRQATHDLAIYQSVAKGDVQRLSRENDSLLLAEGSGLGAGERAAYTAVAKQLLVGLEHSFSIPSSRNVTLTARTGEFPLTIETTWFSQGSRTPLRLLLRLSSGEDALSFPHIANRTEQVTLTVPHTTSNVAVMTRTSGTFALTVELLAPSGGTVLFRTTTFTVRSTAISGVAIGLSIGAVVVLLAWWFRSARKRRRGESRPAHRARHLPQIHEGLEVSPGP